MLNFWIAIGVIAVLLIGIVSIYNSIIVLKNEAENAWRQICVQLKRRHDLIPNFVETVKGFATHEKETLEKVIKARQTAVNLQNASPQAISQAENQLAGALKSLFALNESYPDIKANQNFMALQEELSTTENKIAFARQFYNDSVMNYNQKIQIFPNNVIAGMFSFKARQYFEIDKAETKPVQVKF